MPERPPASATTGVPDAAPAYRIAAYLSVAITALGLCFWGLGANDLSEIDEILHVRAALSMSEHGQWWSPTLGERPYFNKPLPPLWLMAAGFRVFGCSPFTARMWSALFAVAAAVVLQALGTRLYGVFAGWLAGMALATSYTFIYVHGARHADFDSMMIFSFVLSAYLFLRAVDSGRGWTACAIAAASASCAKTFAGLVPAAVCVLTPKAGQAASPTRSVAVAAGNGRLRSGECLLDDPDGRLVIGVLGIFLFRQVVGRVDRLRPEMGSIVRRYIELFLVGCFPWSLVSTAGLVRLVPQPGQRRSLADVTIVLWLAMLALVMIVVMPRGYGWYVVPAIPFGALLVARFVASKMAEGNDRGWALPGLAVVLDHERLVYHATIAP